MTQVLFMTGLIMAPLQLFVFPPLIKTLGVVRWMRVGCVLGMISFLATPNAELFGSDMSTLWAVSVASTTLVNCCLAAVRASVALVNPESRYEGHQQKSHSVGSMYWYPEIARAMQLLTLKSCAKPT